MAIQTGSDPTSGQPTVTFSIAARDGAVVSVVGSFNDWTPGLHSFERRDDGTLAVTVPVRAGEGLHFRYLDSDGIWFDDAESDTLTEYGSFISATRLAAGRPVLAVSDSDAAGKQVDAVPVSHPADVAADRDAAPQSAPAARREPKQRRHLRRQ